MKKLVLTLAALFLGTQLTIADEMDNDIKTQKAKTAVAVKTDAKAGSELDKENPDQSCFWRHRCGWGYSSCFYPSWSYSCYTPSYSCYYPSYSCYTPCYSPCYTTSVSFGCYPSYRVGFGGRFCW